MMLMPTSWAHVLGLLALAAPALGMTDGIEYVIVSQPRLASVGYMKVNVFNHSTIGGCDSGGDTCTPMPLISAGLKFPLGIAMDSVRARLFVADPDQGKVFWYALKFKNGEIHTDGKQYVAASGIEPRWVTVDEEGNVYMTDEPNSMIMKITNSQLKAFQTTPQQVYAGSSIPSVSGPSGIISDGSSVFWANKVSGDSNGCVVKGAEIPQEGVTNTHVLAKNVPKVFGVCSSQNNIFYTGEQKFLYGVKKDGGDPATLSDILVSPRGCGWDGDGTVYVADKGGNAVWSFPSAMHTLGEAQITKVFDIEDPFGVAIFHRSQAKVHVAFRATGVFGSAHATSGLSAIAVTLFATVLAL